MVQTVKPQRRCHLTFPISTCLTRLDSSSSEVSSMHALIAVLCHFTLQYTVGGTETQ